MKNITTVTTDRVCVVGAGPSGLVMARRLRAAGIPFDVYEKHSDVGGIWDPANAGSPVYDSAHFISSRFTSGFYGYPMPDSYPDYPSWRQILDYIRGFARNENLYDYIQFDTPVQGAVRDDQGNWVVTVNGEQRLYRALVIAPGMTWHANEPTFPGRDTFMGEIRHSSTYFHPSEFAGKRVLVVGAGNSGVDIACDAAAHADAAFLSVRRGYRFIPKHIFGMPVDVFFNQGGQLPAGVTVPQDLSALIDALVGDLTRFGLPAPDHSALESHPIVNDQILHHLAHGDITAKPNVAEFDGAAVRFADGSVEEIDLVLLATGYEFRMPFIDEGYFEWHHGRPDLYLHIFNRQIDNLYVLGAVEFADAAYKRFEEMAQLVAIDLGLAGAEKQQFTQLKRHDQPDLRGGKRYLDTPRHANYVDTHSYQQAMAKLRDDFGAPQLTDEDLLHGQQPAV
ncbi:flavin-containing monooxygenase [Nocardia brasiliensis]|uniref:flavin-containing monooxygenase n=1 Tax=Nocardia brasiliensis TaxID=37326 RepID=UPI00245533D4|nr:NAD(P)-binding domain-containing protein [Nocardia brasiliensis]